MAELNDRHMVNYVEGVAGDSLRFIGHHRLDGYEILYIRDDLEDHYSEGTIREIAEEFRWEASYKETAQDRFLLGDLTTSVRMFDNGFVVHCMSDCGDGGTAISFDYDIATQLREVVSGCREFLEGTRY